MSVRLLKVVVQAVFITDVGDDLIEVLVQPVTLTSAQWRALDPQRWADEGAVQINAQLAAPD